MNEGDFLDTVSAVKIRILMLCEKNNMTINKLANISGLSPSSLKSILYGKSKNPKIETIKIICDGFGVTLGEFFSSPEFDNLEQSIQ